MKINRNMSLDVDVVQELQARRLNVSGLANDFFRSFLKLKAPGTDDLTKLDVDILKLKAKFTQLEAHRRDILATQERETKVIADKQAKVDKEKEEYEKSITWV